MTDSSSGYIHMRVPGRYSTYSSWILIKFTSEVRWNWAGWGSRMLPLSTFALRYVSHCGSSLTVRLVMIMSCETIDTVNILFVDCHHVILQMNLVYITLHDHHWFLARTCCSMGFGFWGSPRNWSHVRRLRRRSMIMWRRSGRSGTWRRRRRWIQSSHHHVSCPLLDQVFVGWMLQIIWNDLSLITWQLWWWCLLGTRLLFSLWFIFVWVVVWSKLLASNSSC